MVTKKLEKAREDIRNESTSDSPAPIKVIQLDDGEAYIVVVAEYNKIYDPEEKLPTRCLLHLGSPVTAEGHYHTSQYEETVKLKEATIYSFFQGHALADEQNPSIKLEVKVETKAGYDPTGAFVEQKQEIANVIGGGWQPEPPSPLVLQFTYHVFCPNPHIYFCKNGITVRFKSPPVDSVDGLCNLAQRSPPSTKPNQSASSSHEDYFSCAGPRGEKAHFVSSLPTQIMSDLGEIVITPPCKKEDDNQCVEERHILDYEVGCLLKALNVNSAPKKPEEQLTPTQSRLGR